MITRKHFFGSVGEILAAVTLMTRGYLPVAWRYHHPAAEIDLICRRGKDLLLVEVKTRKNWQAHDNSLSHSQNQRQVNALKHLQQKYSEHIIRRALISITPIYPFIRLTFLD